MVDAFVGTWKLVDTANFDEYMKALGAPRMVARGHPPGQQGRGGCLSRGLHGMGQRGGSATLWGTLRRRVTAGLALSPQSVVTLDGGKLVHVQKWEGKETSLVRELKDGKLVLTLTMGNVVSTRTYEK
ncbi:Fatty acid-binding protein, heart, partial [Charadrius vociferus]